MRTPTLTDDDELGDKDDAALGLALTANVTALRALWIAIRALEDDAASLKHMASHYGDRLGASATSRNAKAAEAQEAADLLRGHARRAQDRVDAQHRVDAQLRVDALASRALDCG